VKLKVLSMSITEQLDREMLKMIRSKKSLCISKLESKNIENILKKRYNKQHGTTKKSTLRA
jgi:hypothetical protein